MPIDLSAIPGAVLTSAGNYFDPTAGVFINPIGANNKGYPEYYPKEGGMYYPNLGRYMTNEERFAKEQSGFSPTEERKPVNAQTIDLGNNLERIITTYNDGSTTEQVGPKSESSALPYFLAVAASGAGDVYNALSGAGAGSGSLASNLTVGEAASTITNPLQVVTKPITNTITDYVVNAINGANPAFAELGISPSIAKNIGLTLGEKALIKTGAAAFVNGVTSELLGGDFEQGAVGTVVGTALDKLPIPGTADLLKTNQDVSFTSLISNLVDRGLSEIGIADQLTDKLSAGVSKGATAGITTAIAGGDSNDILRNTGIGALMGTFGNTKIPGTKLTGDDALELIQDSFLDGSDASNALNNAAGQVIVKANVDPLDQFNTTDLITGSGFGDGKKANVTDGSGADTVKAGAVTVAGGKDNDSIGDTISDYIDLGGYNDLVTSGSGNASINAGAVEVTGASDPCENPNQIRDPITGGCYDPTAYVALGGSGTGTGSTGSVTVTAADCNKIDMDYDPIENKCVERVDISKLPTVKPKTPTPPPVTSTRVVDTFCVPPKIRDNVNGGCVCPPGTTEQADGSCKEPARVTVTASDCYAQGKGYDPKTNSCYDLEYTTLNLTGGSGNDVLNCTSPKIPNAAGTACVCPTGTTEQADGSCKPSVEVKSTTCINAGAGKILSADGQSCVCPAGYVEDAMGDCEQLKVDTITGGGSNDVLNCTSPKVPNAAGTACVCPTGTTEQADGSCKASTTVTAKKCNEDQYKGADDNCYCIDPDQAPNALGLCQDTTSGLVTLPGGGGNDTVKGGGGNDTITECPTGYTYSSKTGKCEFDPIGLPSLFKNLTTGGDGPASYTPNLTQPFTASRSYTKPPDTYDYAGADTVGYEDPYFQRFGPIVYTPPAGYLGAGVQPSPAGGANTDTVDGAGVDTSGGGLAYGGLLSLARGGRTLPPRYLGGITDGMADRVPAHIDGKRPAALSDGEFVIPADVVSHLGNGNSSAGAKILYEMMDRVRKARTGTKKQGREIDAQRFMPR